MSTVHISSRILAQSRVLLPGLTTHIGSNSQGQLDDPLPFFPSFFLTLLLLLLLPPAPSFLLLLLSSALLPLVLQIRRATSSLQHHLRNAADVHSRLSNAPTSGLSPTLTPLPTRRQISNLISGLFIPCITSQEPATAPDPGYLAAVKGNANPLVHFQET